eukprot:1159344-Pelagomonas_calceolata.AAC.18
MEELAPVHGSPLKSPRSREVKSKYMIKDLPVSIPTSQPPLDVPFPKLGVGACFPIGISRHAQLLLHAYKQFLALQQTSTASSACTSPVHAGQASAAACHCAYWLTLQTLPSFLPLYLPGARPTMRAHRKL